MNGGFICLDNGVFWDISCISKKIDFSAATSKDIGATETLVLLRFLGFLSRNQKQNDKSAIINPKLILGNFQSVRLS